MVPKRFPEEPSKLSFPSPSLWNTLQREVRIDFGCTHINDGETTENPMDGHDQPKIYTIRDHTLEVLMDPSVLELHAVRLAHTSHGDEWQLHLRVRVRCGKKEVIADVLVDTGAQVSFGSEGIFFGRISEAQQKTGALEGRQSRNFGWGYP